MVRTLAYDLAKGIPFAVVARRVNPRFRACSPVHYTINTGVRAQRSLHPVALSIMREAESLGWKMDCPLYTSWARETRVPGYGPIGVKRSAASLQEELTMIEAFRSAVEFLCCRP